MVLPEHTMVPKGSIKTQMVLPEHTMFPIGSIKI